jgi:DNA-binding MarR family transcriptional regulator
MPQHKKTNATVSRRASSSASTDEAATRVLRRFRVVFNAVKSHFREVEKKAGVAGAQLWALNVIREQPGIGVRDLAVAMDVHQSTASNLLRGLLELELVTARKEGSDRRAVQLRILPAGTRVLRRAPSPFNGVLPDAIAALDARTLAQLDRDLGKLIAVLNGDKRMANMPLGQP